MTKIVGQSKTNSVVLYTFNTRPFYKIYYGMAIGHSVFWTLSAFAGYAHLQQLEGKKLNSFRELYGDYAEHIAFGSIASLGILFGMMVHRKAKFNIQQVKLNNSTCELTTSRLFGSKKIIEIKPSESSLVEHKGGYNIINHNQKYFLDPRGFFLNQSLLKHTFRNKSS